jgi:putative flippase GtrA
MVTSKFGYHRLKRPIKYMFSTGITFVIEFFLLWLFTDVFNIYYLLSATLAFVITVSIGYILNRWFVFKGSTRRHLHAYINFFFISLGGLLIVIGGLFVLVGVFNVHYLLARILIIILTFLWTYSMNHFVNFRPGAHSYFTEHLPK